MDNQAVERFIAEKAGNQAKILQFLHDQLMAFPEMEAKLRYKIPFFYRKSWICYLNPIKKDGVELVFIRGNELSNEQGILEEKGRKQVRGIELYSVSDIPLNQLLEVVQEALILDEEVPYASKRTKP